MDHQQLCIWFEGICAELNRNPQAATKALTEFRESESALAGARSILQQNQPPSSPIAQFQATLILQYASLKRWDQIPQSERQELRNMLWGLIHNGTVSNHTVPAFIVNKLIQVYVLLWKRGWHETSHAVRNEIFLHVQSFTQNPQGDTNVLKSGAIILRTLVEEFSNRSSAEVGLPLEFHRVSRKSFAVEGLDNSFEIAIATITFLFATATNAHASSMADANVKNSIIGALSESVKLLIELIQWDFGDSDTSGLKLSSSGTGSTSKSGDRDEAQSNQLLALPRKWAIHLLQTKFIEEIFQTYEVVYHWHHQVNGIDMEGTLHCLHELRMFMVGLASITGNFFENDAERIAFGDFILARMTPILERALVKNNVAGFGNVSAGSSSSISNMFASSAGGGVGGGSARASSELRAKECESISLIFLRFLGNYRLSLVCLMPSFVNTLLLIGRTAYELSKEMAITAERQLQVKTSGSKYSSQSVRGGGGSGGYDDDDDDIETGLFSGWRGNTVVLIFDAWCMVLDDPLMTRSSSTEALTSASAAISNQLKVDLRGVAAEVFKQLFQCILHTTLCESLADEDEDENEVDVAMEQRSMDELLSAICTVGRTNFSSSLQHVTKCLDASLEEAKKLLGGGSGSSGGGGQQLYVKELETMRLCTLFASHLCCDYFSADVAENNQFSLETPMIPPFVIDSCVMQADTIPTLQEWVNKSSYMLQMQLHLLVSPDMERGGAQSSHPLSSPYLLQTLFLFWSQYFLRYVEPDMSLYSSEDAVKANLLFRFHSGPDLCSLTDLLLTCIHHIIQKLPLERDLIKCSSVLMKAMAKAIGKQRPDALISLPVIGQMYLRVTGQEVVGQSSCRLNNEGISDMMKALSHIAVRSGSDQMMLQLCGSIHSRVVAIFQYPVDRFNLEAKQSEFAECIAFMCGLGGSPYGMQKMAHSLFDALLPALTWYVQAFVSSDDITRIFLLLLRDYAEAQLSSLSKKSSTLLYQSSLTALQLFSARLRQPVSAVTTGASAAADDEEAAYRSEMLLIVLQLLNHLGVKDLSFDFDDEDTDMIQYGNLFRVTRGGGGDVGYATDLAIEVADVLIYGLESLVPIITPDILRSFPTTCDRYFSFVAFTVSTYQEKLAFRLLSTGGDASTKTFLIGLVQHLLWGAGAVDACSARTALLALQQLAAYQNTSMQSGRPGFGASCAEIFPSCMERLLEMILFPHSCEYGISWDRVDACANALLTLISLDVPRFMTCAQNLIQQQSPQFQPALLACFDKLVTAGGVNITNIDKANRVIFVANMRSFITDARALLLFH